MALAKSEEAEKRQPSPELHNGQTEKGCIGGVKEETVADLHLGTSRILLMYFKSSFSDRSELRRHRRRRPATWFFTLNDRCGIPRGHVIEIRSLGSRLLFMLGSFAVVR